MCGRVQIIRPWSDIHALYRLTLDQPASNLEPRYNVAPMQRHPVVRQRDDGARGAHMLRWGLVPWFAKEPKQANKLAAQCINARSETVAKLASFKGPFQTKRCLVPVDGYYEWQTWADGKQPFLITQPNGGAMTLAGLWERWTNPETKEPLETFTIITTDASPSAARVHTRMPVMLEPDQFDAWLTVPPNEALGMLKPWPGDLTIVPVNRAMSSWKNQTAEDAAPIGPPLP